MSQHLAGLDDAQRAAALSVAPRVAVLAGPGAGKTRVLVAHTAQLHLAERVGVSAILAITFTRLAAQEMRERLAGVLGEHRAQQIQAGTIHAFCLRVLREHGREVGLDYGFSVLDEADKTELLQSVIADLRLQCKPGEVAKVLWADGPEVQDDIFVAAREARWRMRRGNALDLDGLIATTLQLLRERTDIRASVMLRCTHILLDEVQDTDPRQWAIIDRLGPEHVFCVGDVMQSLYGWRGARPDLLLSYAAMNDVEVHRLEHNYRSTVPIVAVANRTIEAAASPLGLRLTTDRAGPVIELLETQNAQAQDAAVICDIAAHAQTGTVGVLARTNREVESFAESAGAMALPVEVVSGSDARYDGPGARAVFAALQWSCNPRDDRAFRRLLRWPGDRISPASLSAMEAVATGQDKTLADAVFEAYREEPVDSPVGALREALQSIRDRVLPYDGHLIAPSFLQAAEALGARPASDILPHAAAAFEETVRSLAAWQERRERANEPAGVLEFLRWLRTRDLQDRIAEAQEPARIRAMTVHAAKGLEFDHVYVLGLIDGRFPLRAGDPDEERRVFYVAATRARTRLVLSTYHQKAQGPKTAPAEPSEYIALAGAVRRDAAPAPAPVVGEPDPF